METVKEQAGSKIQAMMEAYKDLAVPGAPHKQFAKLAGSWSVKGKAWMDPDQPPAEYDGTSEQKMVLDGRFLHIEEKSAFGQQPYAGMNIMGYDNNTGQYVAVNMNTMSTGIYLLTGSASADGKTITLSYSYNEPVLGPTDYRTVISIKSDNNYVMEMYAAAKSGMEMKMMEANYTRK